MVIKQKWIGFNVMNNQNNGIMCTAINKLVVNIFEYWLHMNRMILLLLLLLVSVLFLWLLSMRTNHIQCNYLHISQSVIYNLVIINKPFPKNQTANYVHNLFVSHHIININSFFMYQKYLLGWTHSLFTKY